MMCEMGKQISSDDGSCTCIVCLCSLKILTLTMALLNSGLVDWMIS